MVKLFYSMKTQLYINKKWANNVDVNRRGRLISMLKVINNKDNVWLKNIQKLFLKI